jgi:branched-chain amino acid transport system ATP-binding protein
MASPRLLMIDDMSLGLAPVVVEELMKIFAKIRQNGITMRVVEQDAHLALSNAARGLSSK